LVLRSRTAGLTASGPSERLKARERRQFPLMTGQERLLTARLIVNQYFSGLNHYPERKQVEKTGSGYD
jgi:hypothetical protein